MATESVASHRRHRDSQTIRPEAAKIILGHAAADGTQVYAERDAEKAYEVARQVG